MRSVSTPRSHARGLRGALVGVCSAVVTAGAHGAAGGGLPQGSALILSALVCAVVGVAVAAMVFDGPRLRWASATGGLVIAQALGHATLVAGGGHQHGGLELSPSMVVAHLAAAAVLGSAIAVVEHLYAVCGTLLCWLRLFAMVPQRSTARLRRVVVRVVVARPVLGRAGLGMRAPPRAATAAA
ncbi:Uncharacterised protein [Mycolicibacterium tokaiense]|uniref:Uncharacterized protein n=1 Tax=Mycolicibacterium tokaiense TaxID=39695 RepID=A0A378TLX7_9MYCO|nr:Uncharacterised protein [Mycolicibacterium tokaiense]